MAAAEKYSERKTWQTGAGGAGDDFERVQAARLLLFGIIVFDIKRQASSAWRERGLGQRSVTTTLDGYDSIRCMLPLLLLLFVAAGQTA